MPQDYYGRKTLLGASRPLEPSDPQGQVPADLLLFKTGHLHSSVYMYVSIV